MIYGIPWQAIVLALIVIAFVVVLAWPRRK